MGRCTPPARIGHVAASQAAGANRLDAPGRSQRPAAGTSRYTAGGGLARLSESSRGATGQAESSIEAGTVVAAEAVAVAGEASPATRDRDPVAATPSTPNKRPAANVGNGAPRVAASDGMATASQGITQQCGSDTSLRDGGSPSKTNPYAGPGRLTRRRARSIPRRSPSKKLLRRNRRRSGAWLPARSRAYRIAQHAAVDAIREWAL